MQASPAFVVVVANPQIPHNIYSTECTETGDDDEKTHSNSHYSSNQVKCQC